jgi:hypothetical protein
MKGKDFFAGNIVDDILVNGTDEVLELMVPVLLSIPLGHSEKLHLLRVYLPWIEGAQMGLNQIVSLPRPIKRKD